MYHDQIVILVHEIGERSLIEDHVARRTLASEKHATSLEGSVRDHVGKAISIVVACLVSFREHQIHHVCGITP